MVKVTKCAHTLHATATQTKRYFPSFVQLLLVVMPFLQSLYLVWKERLLLLLPNIGWAKYAEMRIGDDQCRATSVKLFTNGIGPVELCGYTQCLTGGTVNNLQHKHEIYVTLHSVLILFRTHEMRWDELRWTELYKISEGASYHIVDHRNNENQINTVHTHTPK